MVEVRQNPFLLRTILLCGEFVLRVSRLPRAYVD
jgi:hypothetical protein